MKHKATRRTKKKPYEPPRLTEFGTLARLTQVKGGRNADGRGKPRTRLGGRRA